MPLLFSTSWVFFFKLIIPSAMVIYNRYHKPVLFLKSTVQKMCVRQKNARKCGALGNTWEPMGRLFRAPVSPLSQSSAVSSEAGTPTLPTWPLLPNSWLLATSPCFSLPTFPRQGDREPDLSMPNACLDDRGEGVKMPLEYSSHWTQECAHIEPFSFEPFRTNLLYP